MLLSTSKIWFNPVRGSYVAHGGQQVSPTVAGSGVSVIGANPNYKDYVY